MSVRMQVPLSQRRHTNVAVVRYSKKGIRLEVACYKNKVISYRSGTENRLDEVLQVDRIFSSVARGHVASEKDIQTVFGPEICAEDAIKYILNHGDLQVAQHERTSEVDEMFKDIALIISHKCINTSTQRPFPCFVIEQALREIGAGVKLDQPVKKQALSLIRQLVESQIIPIARTNMKVRCSTKTANAIELLRKWCMTYGVKIIEEVAKNNLHTPDSSAASKSDADDYSVLLLIQPSLFGTLNTFVKTELPAGSSVNVLEACVMAVGESDGVSFITGADISSQTTSITHSRCETESKLQENHTRAKSFDGDSIGLQDDCKPRGKKEKGYRKNSKRTEIYSEKVARIKEESEEETVCERFYEKDLTESSRKEAAKRVSNETSSRKITNGREVSSHVRNATELSVIECDNRSEDSFGTPQHALVAQLQQLRLDPLVDLATQGKDDEDQNRKKKRTKRKSNNSSCKPSTSRPVKGAQEKREMDSDEELEGNRKQRKKNLTKKNYTNEFEESVLDEEYFEYNEEG